MCPIYIILGAGEMILNKKNNQKKQIRCVRTVKKMNNTRQCGNGRLATGRVARDALRLEGCEAIGHPKTREEDPPDRGNIEQKGM